MLKPTPRNPNTHRKTEMNKLLTGFFVLLAVGLAGCDSPTAPSADSGQAAQAPAPVAWDRGSRAICSGIQEMPHSGWKQVRFLFFQVASQPEKAYFVPSACMFSAFEELSPGFERSPPWPRRARGKL